MIAFLMLYILFMLSLSLLSSPSFLIFNDAPEPLFYMATFLLFLDNYIFYDFISSHMVFSILIISRRNCYL
jgi:hypothetical protein